jgi:hypothetical protein
MIERTPFRAKTYAGPFGQLAIAAIEICVSGIVDLVSTGTGNMSLPPCASSM